MDQPPSPVRTRVSDLLGIRYPIVQAPMGYLARAPLASAVSNAGGLGIIETSSGQLGEVRGEIRRMRDLTDQPFGVNIAQLLVRDPAEIVAFVVAEGVRVVTTSAGDPGVLTAALHEAGMIVLHVVANLRGALKAVAAGVDGLVVEGGEGGGFTSAREVSTMVVLPLVCSKVGVPVIAAGGICDGVSMAAAFVLGAEGVQMGTRMVASVESPVHPAWKDRILSCRETDSLVLNRFGRPAMRVLATAFSEAHEHAEQVTLPPRETLLQVYFGGDLAAGPAFGGSVAGRIDAVEPVADIVHRTVVEFRAAMASAARYA